MKKGKFIVLLAIVVAVITLLTTTSVSADDCENLPQGVNPPAICS